MCVEGVESAVAPSGPYKGSIRKKKAERNKGRGEGHRIEEWKRRLG